MEIKSWRQNFFPVPFGTVGSSFVSELARLYRAYAEGSAQESVALKAVTILPSLLLQRPHVKSKPKDHIDCLQRRLQLWKDGDIISLLEEGRALQYLLEKNNLPQKSGKDHLARSFAKLTFEGKVNQALQLLSHSNGGLLHLHDTILDGGSEGSVLEILKSKHPPSTPVTASCLINPNSEPPSTHPVIFDQQVTAASIRSAVLRTQGAAGPSGVDAKGWRRLCTSFKQASDDLCHSLALLARRLSTSVVHPEGLQPFLSCRLIALDNNPGVCPIGISETPRRIIAKAILAVTHADIRKAVGSLQFCVGQAAGAEAVVHAIRSTFDSDSTEAVLLVEASNAFNSLNRQVALRNIRHLCPSMATVLLNTYRAPTELFVNGSSILSQEGTTQGDPLAMAMYALATIPLIRKLPYDVLQAWYAENAAASGSLSQLRLWWDELESLGPGFGYFTDSRNTWLIIKPGLEQAAAQAFEGTQVNITTEGRPYLGAPLGSREYVNRYAMNKITEWCGELNKLSLIAVTQPHAAYTAFTHGLANKWIHLSRTTPNLIYHFTALEEIIREKLIPALTGRDPPDDQLRELLSLPCRLGGIGLHNPMKRSPEEFQASMKISSPLITPILNRFSPVSSKTSEEQSHFKAEVHSRRRSQEKEAAVLLKPNLSSSLQRSVVLAQEKGASSWLTAIPITEFGFTLHKSAFRDALCFRYAWQPAQPPTNCECGSAFSVEHALCCPKSGFPSIRRNEVRTLTANLLAEMFL